MKRYLKQFNESKILVELDYLDTEFLADLLDRIKSQYSPKEQAAINRIVDRLYKSL